MAVTIYGLIDPITNQLRYVGKTVKKPSTRLSEHIRVRKNKRNHKECWIDSLKSKGTSPEIIILDEVTEDKWVYWEQFYIAYYKSIGCNLTNFTEGGDTGNLGRTWKVMGDTSGFGNHVKRSVAVLHPNGDFFREFESIKDAARTLGLKSPALSSSIANRWFAKGYFITYKDDYTGGKYEIPKMVKNRKVRVTELTTGITSEYPSSALVSRELHIPSSSLSRYLNGLYNHNKYNFEYVLS